MAGCVHNIDSDIISGSEFCYYVAAVYEDGQSGPSNTACATAEGEPGMMGDLNDDGIINIKNSKYKSDFSPIDAISSSPFGAQFSKAYVRHLFNVNEILGVRISSVLNIAFYMKLMKTIRSKIECGEFCKWSKSFLEKWDNE